MAGRTPDVLVVVLDCLRADDFPGLDGGDVEAPFLRGLLPRSVLFRAAESVAPWTRPAHASLFSGRYPWEHACHTKGEPTLAARFPHLAEELRGAGYSSIAASANPQVAPTSGLGRGFDRIAWGRWGERVSLTRPSERPPFEATRGRGPPAREPARSRWSRVRYVQAVVQHRFIGASALAWHALRSIREPATGEEALDLAPWLEPTFDGYVNGAEADRPLFGFVNLMDAHEPYFASGPDAASLRATLSFYRVPQDHFGYVVGRFNADRRKLARLHAAYRRQVTRLDRRLRVIVESWAARRGSRPWLIVTSDHGQAFGERGAVFHSILPDETHLHVPLLVSPPESDGATATVRSEPVSLLDVYATVRTLAGLAEDRASPSRDLLVLRPPGRVIMAASDGLASGFPFDQFIDRPRRDQMDRVFGVAYSDGWKLWHDAASGAESAYFLSEDPDELRALDPGTAAIPRGLREAAAMAASRMVRPTGAVSVSERLAGWGYYQ